MITDRFREIVEEATAELCMEKRERLVMLRYFLYTKCQWLSMQRIARLTGGKNHTDVHYALLHARDEKYKFAIHLIEQAIKEKFNYTFSTTK